jgi:hypothetical protein
MKEGLEILIAALLKATGEIGEANFDLKRYQPFAHIPSFEAVASNHNR